MSKQPDRATELALYKWFDGFKRKHPQRTPTPREAFEAGYAAARTIYQAHAEEALGALADKTGHV